jgi:hypothetical protein
MQTQIVNDERGRPVIEATAKHLVVLERRREYLLEQLQARQGAGAGKSREFAKQEVSALTAAIAALRYHRLVIEGLDEPVSVLREMVEAYDGPAGNEVRLRVAVRRAKSVLDDFEYRTPTSKTA